MAGRDAGAQVGAGLGRPGQGCLSLGGVHELETWNQRGSLTKLKVAILEQDVGPSREEWLLFKPSLRQVPGMKDE